VQAQLCPRLIENVPDALPVIHSSLAENLG